MNSFNRIHLHWQCAKQRPNHAWFHAKGIAREIPLLVAASVAAIITQWLVWHIK